MLAYRWPLGRTFTYLLTLAGPPSVPHARSFPQRYPLRIAARLPSIAVSTRTPLAGGNIALFADRWKLIDADALPTYQAFIRDHPGQARALVATPVPRRVTGYRLLARAGQLAADALTAGTSTCAPRRPGRESPPPGLPGRPAGGRDGDRPGQRAHPRIGRPGRRPCQPGCARRLIAERDRHSYHRARE
jgi:hypothetical protein